MSFRFPFFKLQANYNNEQIQLIILGGGGDKHEEVGQCKD